MKTCKSTLFRHGKAQTLYMSIGSKVAQDTSFPFQLGDRVVIEIKGNKLEVRKA